MLLARDCRRMSPISVVAILLILLFSPLLVAADPELTPEESAWLEAHPGLRVGIALFPPFLMVENEQGEVVGLAIDYLEMIERKLGVSFQRVVSNNYREAIAFAKAREIDFLLAATPTEERRGYLDFSVPYTFTENLIFVREEQSGLSSLADFNGLRFAVPAETSLVEHIEKNYPGVEVYQPLNLSMAFTWLSSGYVDGVGADATSGYQYTYQKGLSNIRITGKVGFDYQDSVASRNDWPMLGQILNKALIAITAEERRKIHNRWIVPVDPQKVDRETVRGYSYTIAVFLGVMLLSLLLWWTRSLRKEIAHRKAMENRLSYLAYHDEVTGILNRAGFFERLRLAADSDEQYMLLLIGLDHFRGKNEFWGHKVGNEILSRLARRLQTKMPAGASVARTGGDKFGCLIPLADSTPESRARYLLDLVSQPLLLENGTVQMLTATAAIDLPQADGDRPEHPLERAEIALKYGKRTRRGSYHFYDTRMSRDIGDEQQWTDELKMAIQHNQLFLEYQPQLDIVAGRVIGFEALVRWQHPQRGRISPAEFIPRAERLGLISALGDQVLRTACGQARQWLDSGLPFDHIAVNVSVQQFAEGDFAARVADILSATGLPASCLELEITETFFMSEFDQIRKTLVTLSETGVRFAIDDFGTGFSSLLYLKQLPVETIKIAQEFVIDISRDSGSYQIVKAATQLGRNLGMQVIAEGIEDSNVQRVLRDLGCDRSQGYYYSKPVAAGEVDQTLLERLAAKVPGCAQVASNVAAD